MERNKVVLSFVEDFLAFYGVDELRNVEISQNFISGEAIWYDEPTEDNSQKFYWRINLSIDEIQRMKSILEFISKGNLCINDKILVNEETLIKELVSNGWNENIAKESLNNIFETSIDMIDSDGKREDAFFLHY